jgi:hypothetical protein
MFFFVADQKNEAGGGASFAKVVLRLIDMIRFSHNCDSLVLLFRRSPPPNQHLSDALYTLEQRKVSTVHALSS